MTGTTATGVPFPEDYDPVSDTAAAIQQLAETVENRAQAGIVSTGAFTAVNTPVSVAVTFDPPYPAGKPPIVQLTAIQASPQQVQVSLNAAPTISGFTMRANRSTGTAAFNVQWLASPRTDNI